MFTPGNQPVDSYCGKREIRIESIFSGFRQRSPLIYSFGNAHACKSICHCAAFLVPEHLGLSLSYGCAGPESFCPPSLVVGRVTQGATCTPSQHPPLPRGCGEADACDWSRAPYNVTGCQSQPPEWHFGAFLWNCWGWVLVPATQADLAGGTSSSVKCHCFVFPLHTQL